VEEPLDESTLHQVLQLTYDVLTGHLHLVDQLAAPQRTRPLLERLRQHLLVYL
jgi:hypothetical protein